MRFPVKICNNILPRFFRKVVPSCYNPAMVLKSNVTDLDFSNAMQSFKFGKTFKSTKQNRFPLTMTLIKDLFHGEYPVILDIGASDGVTSCDLISILNFKKYFVTDYNIFVHYSKLFGFTFFYNEKKDILSVSCSLFVIFNDLKDCFYVPKLILDLIFRILSKYLSPTKKITLINPKLKKILSNKIFFLKHSLFDVWELENPDLIICANILNYEYFTEQEIINGIQAFIKIQNDGSFLVLVDNRKNEKSSILKFTNGAYRLISRIGSGSDVESIFISYKN